MSKVYQEETVTKRESQAFFILKAFAILSVITAHVCTRLLNQGVFAYIVSAFLFSFSRIGVVAFFAVSGFFYRYIPGDSRRFWKKKLLNLILPWLICATLTFAVSRIGHGTMPYYNWIIGNGSWYYYVTVLIAFYAIFMWISRSRICLFLCVGLTVLSLALETFSINPVTNLIHTPYLNLFNWIGFFAFGILARRYRLDRKCIRWRVPVVLASSIVWLAGFVALIYLNIYEFGYFHLVAPLYEISAVVLLYVISYALCVTGACSVLVKIGGSTYFIYLLHMQIVQMACRFLPKHIAIEPLKPLLGLALMMTLVCIAQFICKKCLKWEWPLRLVGLK